MKMRKGLLFLPFLLLLVGAFISCEEVEEAGKFEFTINGVKKIVSAGDCLYKEPDAVHGCVCLEPGMLIDCFSPMRADFLEKK